MSRLYESCVQIFGSCCGCSDRQRRSRKNRSVCKNNRSDSADFNGKLYSKSETGKLTKSKKSDSMTAHNGVGHVPLREGKHGVKVQRVNHVGAPCSASDNNNMPKEHSANGDSVLKN